MYKKSIAFLIAVIAVCGIAFSSCNNGDITLDELSNQTTKQTKVYTDASEEGTTGATAVTVDNSWRTNYTLEYNYADTSGVSQIREIRTDNYYQAVDLETGYISYFAQNGSDVDEYMLYPSENTAAHTLVQNNSMSTLTSGFMQVSYLDSAFTHSENVVYEGDESVAGRPAKRYLQSVYTEGTLTAYAFVWIDTQYGFASKCAVYTVEGSLYAAWELSSFTVGNVTEADAKLDLSGYTVTEGNA